MAFPRPSIRVVLVVAACVFAASEGVAAEPRAVRALEVVGVAGAEAEAIRERVERELSDAEWEGLRLRVEVEAAQRMLRVIAERDGAEPLERAVALPEALPQVAEAAAWVAKNLAQDQTSELLAALGGAEARSAPPPDVSRAPPPSEPGEGAGEATAGEGTKPSDPERCEAAPTRPLVVALVYPVATNFAAPCVATSVDLALVYGRVQRVHGAQLGVVATTVRRLDGARLAIAGVASGGTDGATVDVLVGIAGGGHDGVALAGGFSGTAGDHRGAQIAGLVAWTSGASVGLKLSGVASLGGGPVDGAVIAGVANVHPGGGRGVAFAPVNVTGDFAGLQVGLVNVAQRATAQIGVVNVAHDRAGASVALVPITRDTRLRPMALATNRLALVGALQIANGALYALPSIGVGGEDGGLGAEPSRVVAPGFAFGGHLDFDGAFLDADLGYRRLFRTSSLADASRSRVELRAVVGIPLARRIAVIAGSGLELELPESGRARLSPLAIAGVQF
jgi:hypothetical protein